MQTIERRWFWLGLAGITLLGFVLRVVGLGFGGDQLARPDEQMVAQTLIDHLMLPWSQGQASFNPQFFEYPSLLFYLLAPLYWAKYVLGLLSHQWSNLEQYRQAYQDHPGQWFALARWMSALAGTATVTVVGLWARQWAGQTPLALAAALFMALAYLAVRESHFGVTDTVATGFVAACLLATATFQQTQQTRWLYGALVLAGLGASAKYPAALVTVAPLAAYWLSSGVGGNPWSRLRQLGALALVAVGVFLATSPFIVLDFHGFWGGFSYQLAHLSNGHGLDLGIGWLRHAEFTLPIGLGWSLLSLAVLGIAGFIWRPSKLMAPVVIFAVAYYVWMGKTPTVFVRYMLPLVPVLCGLAVFSLGQLLQLKPSRPAVEIGVLLVLVGLSIWPTVQSDRIFLDLLQRPDTRELAADWVLSHVPTGVSVAVGPFLSHVHLPRQVEQWILASEAVAIGAHSSEGVVTKTLTFVPPRQWNGQQLPEGPAFWSTNSYTLAPIALCQRNVQAVFLSQSPLPLYQAPEFELSGLRQNPRVQPVMSWQGLSAPTADYDGIDAFFIPYRLTPDLAREANARPGPTLHLFAWDCPALMQDFARTHPQAHQLGHTPPSPPPGPSTPGHEAGGQRPMPFVPGTRLQALPHPSSSQPVESPSPSSPALLPHPMPLGEGGSYQ
jgi:4-amino-4-deoxy-L-arabinose transferase-like glycosyltransferase